MNQTLKIPHEMLFGVLNLLQFICYPASEGCVKSCISWRRHVLLASILLQFFSIH